MCSPGLWAATAFSYCQSRSGGPLKTKHDETSQTMGWETLYTTEPLLGVEIGRTGIFLKWGENGKSVCKDPFQLSGSFYNQTYLRTKASWHAFLRPSWLLSRLSVRENSRQYKTKTQLWRKMWLRHQCRTLFWKFFIVINNFSVVRTRWTWITHINSLSTLMTLTQVWGCHPAATSLHLATVFWEKKAQVHLR